MNEQDIINRLASIECALSPENLCCDGELPRSEVNRRFRKLNTEKVKLEKQLGRVPSFKELYKID